MATEGIRFTDWAVEFFEKTHLEYPDDPFFLYLSLSSPHSPHVTADFALGKSDAGPRRDMAWLVDWSTGRIMDTLEQLGLTENTLIIVTSEYTFCFTDLIATFADLLDVDLPEGSCETSDLWSDHPEIVVQLTQRFSGITQTSN